MTCFWDALIRELQIDNERHIILGNYTNPVDLVNCLKSKNTNTNNITWQDEILGEKQKEENYEWIKTYNESNINNGHLTSTADPFLILISFLMDIKIILNYCNSEIIISPPVNKIRYTIKLNNSNSHMS